MRLGPWLAGRGPWPVRRPHYVSIDVCDRCNLRCVSCAAWGRQPGPGLVEPDLFRRILRNLDGLQGSELDLIGAEPTLHPALPELTAATAEAGFRPRLFTNGTRVDAALAERLVSAGLTQVTVSLDGASPASHDRLRGVAGAHTLALAAVEHFAAAGRARGLEVSTFTVVSRENFRELPEIAPLARKRGASRSAFHFVSQVPETACHAAGASAQYAARQLALLLGTEELALFRASVTRALEESASPSLALLRVLGRKTLIEGRFPLQACRFVRLGLNVASDGRIYPCSHFSNLRWGSLAESHWRDLWGETERQAFLHRLDRGLFEACAYCCHHVHNLTLLQLARVALHLPLREEAG
jgi:radical SAM protein with 4Fe4S-binding SPASM domain